jgi:hypothetical protein
MKTARLIWLIPPIIGVVAAIAGYMSGPQAKPARMGASVPKGDPGAAGVSPAVPPETQSSSSGSTTTSAAKRPGATKALTVGTETLDQVLGYPSTLHRRGALKRFFERMLPAQFPIALAEIMRREDLADSEALPMLFRGWAECAPAEGARYVLTLPPGSQRFTIFGAFIRAWLRKDFAAAKEWGEKELKSSELQELHRYASELEGYAAIAVTPPVRTLEEALALPEEQRMGAAARWLRQRVASDVPGVLAEIEKITDPLLKMSLSYDILRSCADRDPLTTLRWIDKQPADTSNANSGEPTTTARWAALYGLAAKDPTMAKSYIADLQPGLLRDQSADALASTMFKTDRAGAIAYCEDYLGSNPKAAFGALLISWLPEDPERAGPHVLEYINNNYPGDTARRAGKWAATIMQEWIKRDASSAAQFATGLPVAAQENVFVEVAQQWCRADGEKALKWAAALPEGPTRNTALLEFTYAWSQHDSKQTTAWLERQPPDAGRWAATEGFVVAVMDTDADGALSWARTIPDENRQLALLRRSWQRWAQQNPTSALKWLEGGSLSEGERAAIVGKE